MFGRSKQYLPPIISHSLKIAGKTVTTKKSNPKKQNQPIDSTESSLIPSPIYLHPPISSSSPTISSSYYYQQSLAIEKKMGSDGKVYSLEDVSKHNSKEDCWLIIGGKVYNVTNFLDDHPGGDEVLLQATGKDATDDFEDVGHSSTARAMMDEYFVGEIDATTIPSKTKNTPPKKPHSNRGTTSDFIIKLLQFFLPLIILGLAVAVRIYTKSE